MDLRKITFEEKLEPIRKKLYQYAFCYVKNEHDALDIVSDTVYKAYISYHKLKNKEYFETWITRILINTALDHCRKGSKVMPMDSLPEQVIQEPSVSREEQWDLYEALDTLEEENKSFIILKFFEDKSFREIAEIYQMPEGTVKSKVYRILQDLRFQLEKGGRNY
ncbi:MAG TPA: RNA polymerase subunit sigma-24 [Lachnospiraceae bacterium]|nr:RNA polymerase subunit sigma-24 [Lachnospiraceae bacterium]